MIFKLLLYYALGQGAVKGLKKKPPQTLKAVDELLRKFYLEPIREQLNRPIDPRWFDNTMSPIKGQLS